MTIKDMLEQGIILQGGIDVRIWSQDECGSVFCGDALDLDEDADFARIPIDYAYAVDGVGLVTELGER